MEPFKISENHSCNQCGAPIKAGETVFAANWDRVRNGGAICQKCFDAASAPVVEKPVKAAGKPEPTEKPDK